MHLYTPSTQLLISFSKAHKPFLLQAFDSFLKARFQRDVVNAQALGLLFRNYVSWLKRLVISTPASHNVWFSKNHKNITIKATFHSQ